MNEIVCIENANGIILALHAEKTVEHPLEREAFALILVIRSLADNGARLARYLGRIVVAVIGNHEYVIKFLRIIKALQVVNQLSNDGALVVRRHDHGKRLLRCEYLLFFATPQAKEGNDAIIYRKEKHDELQRNHHSIEPIVKQFFLLMMKTQSLPLTLAIIEFMMPKSAYVAKMPNSTAK